MLDANCVCSFRPSPFYNVLKSSFQRVLQTAPTYSAGNPQSTCIFCLLIILLAADGNMRRPTGCHALSNKRPAD